MINIIIPCGPRNTQETHYGDAHERIQILNAILELKRLPTSGLLQGYSWEIKLRITMGCITNAGTSLIGSRKLQQLTIYWG